VSRSAKQAVGLLTALTLVLVAIVVIPSRANRESGLRVQVVSGRRAEPGAVEPYSVTVLDTKGRVLSARIDFGDGRVEEIDVEDEECGEPLVREFAFDHAFEFTGVTTIEAVVETGGCGAERERAEAIRTVEIKAIRR
jgi:hypothetical protein